MRFDLSDEEWSVLEPLMPKSRKSARPHDRRIINAIFYVLRTGIRGAICPNAMARTRVRTIGSTAGLGEGCGSVSSMLSQQNRATVCT